MFFLHHPQRANNPDRFFTCGNIESMEQQEELEKQSDNHRPNPSRCVEVSTDRSALLSQRGPGWAGQQNNIQLGGSSFVHSTYCHKTKK